MIFQCCVGNVELWEKKDPLFHSGHGIKLTGASKHGNRDVGSQEFDELPGMGCGRVISRTELR